MTTVPAEHEPATTVQIPLELILSPIVHELNLTQELYRETILASAERSYFQEIIHGAGNYVPDEFRVEIADQVAKHLLQTEGKWIRSALCLLSASACGKNGLQVHQVAVAVELVHLATLIHDDIIDQAPMRRGMQSVAGAWGNSVSVLMGDFLYSKAFRLLLASQSIPAQNIITQATGQMCLGEIKQLCFATDSNFNETGYLEMIENKTASLMAAACAAGAEFSPLEDTEIQKFHEYGHSLGMVFQITDDVLDYTSATDILGKEKCGDLRNGKVTLPLIHLFSQNGAVKDIVTSNEPVEDKSKKLIEAMYEHGSIEYAYSIGERYGEKAHRCLDHVKAFTGDSPSLQSLHQLVDFILSRKH